jgi:hypothetical protein
MRLRVGDIVELASIRRLNDDLATGRKLAQFFQARFLAESLSE